jgi:hypothetical protein
MRNALLLLTVAGFLTAFSSAARAEDRVFELRTYTAADGKLDALKARFKDHTNAIFNRLHMQIIGFWTPTDGDKSKNTLIYILAFPSRDAATKAWAAFQADPEWIKVRDESEKNGKLAIKVESVFMSPTAFSPVK